MVSYSISFRVAVWARDHLNRAPYTHELKQDAGWLAGSALLRIAGTALMAASN